jgi:2'-5' RNA ligase
MARKHAPDALTLFDALVYTCAYRLVIDPASHAAARVMEWRQLLRGHIGKFNEAYQMPGIELFHAELPPEYAGPLTDAVARGCKGYAPFTLNLGGLVHSEDKRTIYLEVQEKGTVAALRQRIVDHVQVNRRIKKLGVRVVERPMVVIASGLKQDQFASAWALLAAQSFTVQQRVSDVVLLKRELTDDSLDEHVRTVPLEH